MSPKKQQKCFIFSHIPYIYFNTLEVPTLPRFCRNETNSMVVAIHLTKISCLVFHRGQLTSLAVVNGRRLWCELREQKHLQVVSRRVFEASKIGVLLQKKHLGTIDFQGWAVSFMEGGAYFFINSMGFWSNTEWDEFPYHNRSSIWWGGAENEPFWKSGESKFWSPPKFEE